jgi:hypothetical protein
MKNILQTIVLDVADALSAWFGGATTYLDTTVAKFVVNY